MGPCKNRQCRSYGQVHPNCRCYAKGGAVKSFCEKDNMHDSNCEYYAKGGAVESSNMKGLNLSKFKKQKEDNKTVTMVHENGHTIKIMKKALSPMQRKQMERLPIYAADGYADMDSVPSADDVKAPLDISPDLMAAINPKTSTQVASNDPTPAVAPPSYSDSPIGNKVISPDQVNADLQQPQSKPAPASVPTAQNFINKAPPKDPLANISAGDAYAKERAGIAKQVQAESTLAQDELAAEQNHQQELQDAQKHWALSSMQINRNINDTLSDIKNSHIDPNHYLENQTVPQKIGTAIGLIFGGFSKNGVNPAQQWLNQQIDRDIMRQKNDIENKKTVYSGYLDQYKNAAVADQLARATQLGVYASKIKEAAAKAGTPLAQAKGLQLAAELEQKMIPLQQNAHLINQFNQFNGGDGEQPGAGRGNEAQFVTALNSAQHINPTLYADQQSKYVPGVGIASHPVPAEDRSRLQNLDQLTPLIDKAIAAQKRYGMTGATLSMHPINNSADATALQEALNVKLGELTNVNRLNGQVYGNYHRQIGDIGAINAGGTIRTLENLKAQAEMDRNSAIKSMGLVPFSDAKAASGLTAPQQNSLNIFMRNNPKVDQGTAIEVLKNKGII